MSLRQLVDGDCGGVNPLMQLGGQFTRDAARKDEGLTPAQFERGIRPDEQLVNDFLGQVAAPPQSFQMQTLLQEMREIEHGNAAGNQHLHVAPRVIDEVTGQWTKEFAGAQMLHLRPQQQQVTHVLEFFDEMPGTSNSFMRQQRFVRPEPYMAICPPYQAPQQMLQNTATAMATQQFFEESDVMQQEEPQLTEDWVQDFEAGRQGNEQAASDYNEKFWQRLQDEWQKISEETDHPWLSELNEQYDPYEEYHFAEENPMSELENAFERGKEYLAEGDIPSAVLCFEVAATKNSESAEVWELLGLSQAENEMDPQSIAALKRSLELKPGNKRALMALAVCYTNESLQSYAVKMLINWMLAHPKYSQLVKQHPTLDTEQNGMASSLIEGNKLQEVQNLYLEAVRSNPNEVDAELQEALGVLYNLSSEFDKAVDCFRAALQVDPQNAKLWNRLGASLANGSRSVEAVEAYQRALQLEPGFIRVRYNVGVCCMNLKAYKQAVEHLLIALNMQVNSAAKRELSAAAGMAAAAAISNGQQMSECIWTTLKMVVSLMGRNDLQGHMRDRNLEALNEAFKE